ncbi:hypothetical protein CoNPh11_CDS0165 [Staphylococcus phage S-CoN_Ph11]|nr:hypothetical protein CoNPh11_CDS0165 [Staphylococcus phage S-CoN_Ph11]
MNEECRKYLKSIIYLIKQFGTLRAKERIKKLQMK